MSTTLREVLRGLVKGAEENASSHLFRNCRGEPYRSCRTAVEKAKIKDFRFHDLRYTFVSRLVMAKVDIRTVQELMGHKTIAMTLRYSHLLPDHQRKTMEAVESWFSAKSPANSHDAPTFAPLSEKQEAM
jgi:integrase